MTVKAMKKTLNLHKYRVRVNNFVPNWKLILPAAFAISGLVFGCMNGKENGIFYQKITELFKTMVLEGESSSIFSELVKLILFPSIFSALIYFNGLCVFGGLTANLFPFIISILTGMTAYYMYSSYMLKGLAYCIIMIFPYAVFCTAGMIFAAAESMNMAETILQSLTEKGSHADYTFRIYSKKFFTAYLITLSGAVVKILLSRLFGGLFLF